MSSSRSRSSRQVQIVRERLGGVHLDEFARTPFVRRNNDDDVAAFARHMRANGEPLRRSEARWRERFRLFRRLLRARVVVRMDGRDDHVVITVSPKLAQAMQTMTSRERERVIRMFATNSQTWCTACIAGKRCDEHRYWLDQ